MDVLSCVPVSLRVKTGLVWAYNLIVTSLRFILKESILCCVPCTLSFHFHNSLMTMHDLVKTILLIIRQVTDAINLQFTF